MKRIALLLPLLALAARAGDVDPAFLETWAFAADRKPLLERLAPGSDERFLFTVLLAQQEGRVADARRALDDWTAEWRRRSGSRDGEPQSEDFGWMKRRQAVLEFEASPPGSDALALAKALDVEIPDPQPEAEEVPDRFPSVLEDEDPAARALKEWSRDGDGKTLRRDLVPAFVPAALAAGLRPAPEDVRAILEHANLVADAPGILDLVETEVRRIGGRAFESHKILSPLPRASLLELGRRIPELAADNWQWAACVLKTLSPGAETGLSEKDSERAWLARIEDFAESLPDSRIRAGLLADVRFRRLELSRGWPSADDLVAFLKTPRRREDYMPYVGFVRNDLESFDGVSPVLRRDEENEEAVVRACLVRALEAGADEEAFRRFVKADVLGRWAVEAALLAGRPVDDARVREALGDEAFRALRDRQELAWARGTEELVFAADAPVSLALDVKNVPSLRVAVYDVDPFAAARALGGEPDAAIDVDGNVPTAERALDFSAVPAIRRHAETLDLPELAAPGVYLVEVSGGSLSCRALVRKGRLRVASRTGAAGHVFTALADDGAPLRDAELLLDGRLFRADPETGAIRVPFAEAKAGRRTKTAVVSAGRLAAPFSFAHEPERYAFDAAFLLPPEGLVAGSEATLVVHPTLVTGAGDPVSLSVVEHPVLALRTKDLDGTESLETTPLGALSDGDDVVRRFRVPARLRSVEATLSGTVRNVASGTDDAVSARFSLETGALAETDRVETLLLVRDSAGARLELRGRTGERIPHREVALEVGRRDGSTRKATLQGDADGVVRLGALPDATSVSATCLGASYRWFLTPDEWEGQAHEQTVAEGEALELTLPGWRGDALPARDEIGAWLSLRETLADGSHGESFVSAVRPLAGDRVRIEGLPPGDYALWRRLDPWRPFRIRVVAAQPKAREGAGLVASAARGFEDAAARRAPRVAGFEAKGGRVRVRLADAGPDARLHVVARRTVPMHDNGMRMVEAPGFLDARGWRWPAPDGVECLSGIRLGDEARYVRERRALPPRIGNLLDAPSVLVSPWSPEAAPTSDVGSFAAPGLTGSRSPGQRGRPLGRWGASGGSAGGCRTPSPVYDFFAEPAVVLPNLVPDANGAVELPLAALRGAHDLLLVCADGPRLSSRAVRLPSGELGARDLRLRSELDPDEVWTRRKSAVAMAAGEEIPASADAATSWQAYATVGDLFRLFQAIGPDGDFAEFSFVAEWATLPRDRRLELYGAHACHELDVLLAFADEGFFREIVAPRLREKRRRDFVDSWLLGEDLSPWLEPGVFDALTLHEKALAVRAPPGAKAPAPAAAAFAARLARQARDRDEARAPDDDLQARLFAGALGALGAPETAEAKLGLALAGGAVHFDSESRNFAPAPAMAAPEAEDDSADWDAEEDLLAEEAEEGVDVGDADVGPERSRRRRLLSREEIARLTNAIHEDAAARAKQAAFRRSTPETREWRESGWWHRPAAYPPRTEDWIAWNGFWSDVFASSSRTVLSPRVAEIAVADATPSFSDRMFALAVSGLPFEGPGVSLETRGDGTSVFKAASPALLFREVSERAAAGEAADPVPVVQRFFDPADRTAVRDGETWEKSLPDGGPFYAGRPYGVRTVLSNPTGRKRAVSALVQIPEGAMPLAGAAATRERTVRLEPYGSWTDETLFYFPAPAEKPLAVQPAGVVERGAPAGRAGAFSCRVEAGPPPPDRTSWAWIARNGTDDEVLAFLRGRNLLEGDADLSRVAWRAARDKAFFEKAMAALDGRVSPEERGELFAQAFRHGDRARIAEFFALAPAIERDWVGKLFGPWFRSALVRRDDEDAGAFEHREFRPLLHARVHPFGDRSPDNEALDEYWTELLARIAFKPAAEPDDRLLAAICLYAMDRPDDAAAQMRAAGPAAAPAGSLAGDWLRAYAAFCAGKPEEAEALAAAHAGWPLEPWKGRWRELASQLAQIRGGADGADAVGGGEGDAPALPRAGIDLSEPSPGVVRGTGGEGGVLRAWPVDVEMLFSARPFDSPGGGASATFVRPAWETPVPAAAAGAAEWEVELPKDLAARDLALEATGPDGASKASLLHAPSSLRVRTAVPRGEIVVLGPDGRPVPGAYVKVYARDGADGPISFHKDGYTDLRGVFDYASVSARPDISGLEFSLLVLRDGLGSRILRAPAP